MSINDRVRLYKQPENCADFLVGISAAWAGVGGAEAAEAQFAAEPPTESPSIL